MVWRKGSGEVEWDCGRGWRVEMTGGGSVSARVVCYIVQGRLTERSSAVLTYQFRASSGRRRRLG